LRKPKVNRKGEKGKPNTNDQCQTPFYGIDPLAKYIKPCARIWESACGEGNMVKYFSNKGFDVIASDLLPPSNTDFFTSNPDGWDIQITNPPYSIKYPWLKRSYELQKPFALLMPVDVIGAKSAQVLFKRYGIEIILLDKRINFKMPNLGYEGDGAQFTTFWYTWGLGLGATHTYETFTFYEDEQLKMNLFKGEVRKIETMQAQYNQLSF
jgi:hypothetical protein